MKKPDKKHPFGYGRIEYLSSMIVAGIVLYAGITSIVESIKKIIHPEAADYSRLSLIIIGLAVLAHDWVLQLHGFYLEESEKKIRFDVVIDFSMDAAQGLEILYRELQEKVPGYTFEIISDVDVSVTEME